MEMLFKFFPTLYYTSKTGKVHVWSISVDNTGEYTTIITKYGEVENKQLIKEGKNKGKDDEISSMSIATELAKSEWLNKKNKGYTEK